MSLSTPDLAIFLPALHGGGAERIMLNLADGIAERGYAVDLVLAKKTGPYVVDIPPSVRLVDLNARSTFLSVHKLARYLRENRPKVLMSALARANVTAVWARRLAGVPTKVVISIRNTLSQWVRQSGELHARLTLPLAKLTYPYADQIITVSKGVADDLKRLIAVQDEKIRPIYNPVITPALCGKVAQPCHHPWLQEGQPPVFMGTGRLSVQKDFGTLLRAFAQLRQQHTARLMILGEGEQREMLEKLASELGISADVAFLGWVDNPYPYMRRAHTFVLSSRWEGLPGVLIEAMVCGPHLIATDCPHGPREVLADGAYGQLVPLQQPAAMCAAMQNTITGAVAHCPPSAWQPFEREHVINQFESVLFTDSRAPLENNRLTAIRLS